MAEGMGNPFGELTHNTLLEPRKTNNVKQVAGFEPVTSDWEADICRTISHIVHE